MPSETERRILHLLETQFHVGSPQLLARHLGLNNQHLRNVMASLHDRGYLRRLVRGLYEVTKKGKGLLGRIKAKLARAGKDAE